MSKQFYYQVMGEIFGPIGTADLRQKAGETEIMPDTLVRVGEEGDWVEARRLKGLFDEHGNPVHRTEKPPNLPRPKTESPSQKSETRAASSTDRTGHGHYAQEETSMAESTDEQVKQLKRRIQIVQTALIVAIVGIVFVAALSFMTIVGLWYGQAKLRAQVGQLPNEPRETGGQQDLKVKTLEVETLTVMDKDGKQIAILSEAGVTITGEKAALTTLDSGGNVKAVLNKDGLIVSDGGKIKSFLTADGLMAEDIRAVDDDNKTIVRLSKTGVTITGEKAGLAMLDSMEKVNAIFTCAGLTIVDEGDFSSILTKGGLALSNKGKPRVYVFGNDTGGNVTVFNAQGEAAVLVTSGEDSCGSVTVRNAAGEIKHFLSGSK